MASAYPTGLDSFATNKANATATTTDHPTHHNDLADAVNKIEAELGVNPSGASATVAARFSTSPTLQILGSNPATGTVTFTTTLARYCRRISLPGAGAILAVGAWFQPLADNVPGTPSIGILTEGTNEPGQMFAANSGWVTDQFLLNTTDDVARMIWWPIVAPISAAADVWVEFFPNDLVGGQYGIKVDQGAANQQGTKAATGTWLTEKGSTSATFTANDDEFIIQALFQAATYL